MTYKRPDEIAHAAALRQAGYTMAAIADKTGISPSTLQRHFRKLGTSKGKINDELIVKAKQELLNDAGFIEDIKHIVASQITDDLSLSKRIRESALMTLEQLDEETSPILKSRSLSAIATTTKLTSDVMRRALKINDSHIDQESLPTLTIVRMSDSESERLKKSHESVPELDESELDDL